MYFDRERMKDILLKDFEKYPNTPQPSSSNIPLDSELEEYFKEASSSKGFKLPKKSWLYSGVVVTAIILFIGLGMYAYRFNRTSQPHEEDIVLVEADKSPYRVKPEEPGGIVIPDMDKTVYDVIKTNRDPNAVKPNLLPEPEEPIVLPSQQAPEKQDLIGDIIDNLNGSENILASNTSDSTQTQSEETQVRNLADELPVDQTVSKKETRSDVEKIPSKTPQDPSNSKAKASDTALTSAKELTSLPKGKFMVQLGAFKQRSEALELWGKVNHTFKSVFANSHYFIERAQVPEKGVFYRLKIGPYGSETQARQVCKKLSETNQGCFVVKT